LISGAIAAVREPPSASQGVTEKSTALPCRENSAYLRRLERADERTRTADPISLRVITHALQGVAQVCKSRISKPISFLRLAGCCTVLRSRWYQSGINIALAAALYSTVLLAALKLFCACRTAGLQIGASGRRYGAEPPRRLIVAKAIHQHQPLELQPHSSL
jgi:hypothetical protein